MTGRKKNNKKMTMRDIRERNASVDVPEIEKKTEVCGRCKYEFYISNMKKCPHPVVQKACGKWICYYCCRKCRHGQWVGSGVRCIYPQVKGG